MLFFVPKEVLYYKPSVETAVSKQIIAPRQATPPKIIRIPRRILLTMVIYDCHQIYRPSLAILILNYAIKNYNYPSSDIQQEKNQYVGDEFDKSIYGIICI